MEEVEPSEPSGPLVRMVNLIGDHTDSTQGPALPMAIDLG